MKQTKTILSMLCAAALFAACSSTDELEPVVQTGQQTAEEAVGFDVYTRGTQVTRAGYVGEMDLTALRVAGFGVYGYVTSATTAELAKWGTTGASSTPDFMANQQVAYAGGAWSYSPLKYWPNQANIKGSTVDGNTNTTNQGTNIDYVSFFAYAPYVDIASVTAYTAEGDITTALADASKDGIVALPANNATGDPKVGYRVATNPVNSVDLMYGVAARAYVAGETTGRIGQPVAQNNPFLDMTKEVVADKLNYNFKHALTKLAVNVDAYFDEVRTGTDEGTNDVDPNTRIVIDEILLSTGNVSLTGILNLNNYMETAPDGKPKWESTTAMSDFSLQIAPSLKYVSGNKGSVTYFAQQPLGVTKKKQSVLGYAVDGTTPASLMFIPKAEDQTVTIKITYHVITRDARLTDGYNDIENVIQNVVAAGTLTFEPGKSTVLNLHIGMTSVKFDAVITDWDNTATVQEVDLPANVTLKSLTAGSSEIDKYGAVTLTDAKATFQDDSNLTLSINDVIFTSDAAGNEVIPVTDGKIPGNYTADSKTIYMWFSGKSATITQNALAVGDFTSLTPASSSITKDAQDVTLTVATNASVWDFDISNWNVQISSDDGANYGDPVSAKDPSGKTFKVAVTANSTGSDISYKFKITNKSNSSLTLETATVTQAHP